MAESFGGLGSLGEAPAVSGVRESRSMLRVLGWRVTLALENASDGWMSVFYMDPDNPDSPLRYLQEKSLSALREAARLVDLANEPDTAQWYARELRQRAEALIQRLVVVVGVIYQTGDEAVQPESWQGILERGSFALALWCKKYAVADPAERDFGLIVDPEAVVEAPSSDELEVAQLVIPGDSAIGVRLKLYVYSLLCRVLSDDELSRGSRRLLSWLLYNLQHSEYGDVVAVSRRFLPRDIDCPREEVLSAYRELWDRGLVRRVDELCEGGKLAVRLIVEGLNEPKQDIDYRDEDFGADGDWIGGVRTTLSRLGLPLSESQAAALTRWKVDLEALRASLQERVGAERAIVLDVSWGSGLEQLSLLVAHLPSLTETELSRELTDIFTRWLVSSGGSTGA